jgi:hypothetical protein
MLLVTPRRASRKRPSEALLSSLIRAVGVSGSSHTKAALARRGDGLVELHLGLVEADVEEGRLLDEGGGGGLLLVLRDLR